MAFFLPKNGLRCGKVEVWLLLALKMDRFSWRTKELLALRRWKLKLRPFALERRAQYQALTQAPTSTFLPRLRGGKLQYVSFCHLKRRPSNIEHALYTDVRAQEMVAVCL
jgi:hypothetical protein